MGDAGAYPGIGAMLPTGTRRMSMGTYALPKVAVDIACAATNTTPTGAFRGAGRPEAASMVERIVDQAALELDLDPVELRRRNFIAPDRFPFDTLTGVTYDSGDYDLPLRRVLELSDYDELRREQAARRADGSGAAARHRAVHLRGDHRRGRLGRLRRRGRPPRRLGHGHRGHVGPRPGPRAPASP